jgi:GNAT superfamily N-acetyltransferase
VIVVRRAGEPDRTGIEAMHAACSLASRIGRWHAPLRSVPARYLDDALSGRAGHVCALAEVGADIVGFASAVRGFGGAWDLGVLVRDELQRQGVGTRLMDAVVHVTSDCGADSVTADLRPDRRFLLDVLCRYGPVTARRDGDGFHARVDVSADARLHGGADVAACAGERVTSALRVGIAG